MEIVRYSRTIQNLAYSLSLFFFQTIAISGLRRTSIERAVLRYGVGCELPLTLISVVKAPKKEISCWCATLDFLAFSFSSSCHGVCAKPPFERVQTDN